MLCPISGKLAETPVVTPQGHCYEERLLKEYRKTHGDIDPVTGESYDPEQLITIKNGVTVESNVEALSIAQLLSKIQGEYDVLLLQNFKLRTALDSMKGQLTQALYQHDAACRVVARLTRERDHFKARMTTGPAASSVNEAVAQGFSAAKLEEITVNAQDLQTGRKSRSSDVYPNDKLSTWKCTESTVTHEAARPGVTDVTIKNDGDRDVIVTSGVDGHVTLTSMKTMSRISRFQASSSAVTCVDVHPDTDVIVAGCHNKSLRFFIGSTQNNELSFDLHKSTQVHSDPISSVEIHPLGDFVMSGGQDSNIVFTDIETGNAMGPAVKESHGLSTLKFHPDGNIFLSGGRDGTLGVWDIRDMSEKMRAEVCSSGHITSLQVNENGYHLSTVDTTGTVKVWDLRKFQPSGKNEPVTSHSIIDGVTDGVFNLAMAGHNNLIAACGPTAEGLGIVRIGTLAKKAKEINFGPALTSEHTDIVTRCAFVPNKNEVVTVSKDNTVKVWKPDQ